MSIRMVLSIVTVLLIIGGCNLYLAKRFYLYVVTDFAHSPRPCVIENPIRAGITFEKRTVKSETNLWVAKISA